MTSTATTTAPTDTAPTDTAHSGSTNAVTVSALTSSHGHTQIADTVVAKIAGLAAREVRGVYALGDGAVRAFDALRERIPGATSNLSHGVAVEVGALQAAVDLDVVVDYGVGIVEVAADIRRNIVSALERMTGLQVVEVNIAVGDIHLPSEQNLRAPVAPSTPRVA